MGTLKVVVTLCAVGVPVFFLYQSCGITKPRYIEYANGEDPPSAIDGSTNGTDGNTGNALTVFTEQVQPAITSSCATSICHGGGAGELTLTPEDPEANRTALKAFADNAQAIFDKISAATHGGGDQSGKLSLAALEAWFTAESEGSTGSEGTGGTETAEPECPPESIFLAKIQPAIASSCAGCHGAGAGGGLTLETGDAKAPANRQALYDSTGTTAELYDKISLSNGKTHDGGDRSGDLPKANIEAWITAESECK